MKTTLSLLMGMILVCIIPGLSLQADSTVPATIQVAPNVLNINCPGAITRVTVHTNLPFNAVNGASVTLNGVSIVSYFADDCGNFVGKFDIEAIKATVTEGINTMVLTGSLKDGTVFAGQDDIKVVIPKGR